MKKIILTEKIPSESHKCIISPWINKYKELCVDSSMTHDEFVSKYLKLKDTPNLSGYWYRFSNGVLMFVTGSENEGVYSGFGFNKVGKWFDLTYKRVGNLSFFIEDSMVVRTMIMAEANKRGYKQGEIVRIQNTLNDECLDSGHFEFNMKDISMDHNHQLDYVSWDNSKRITVYQRGTWTRTHKRFGR